MTNLIKLRSNTIKSRRLSGVGSNKEGITLNSKLVSNRDRSCTKDLMN